MNRTRHTGTLALTGHMHIPDMVKVLASLALMQKSIMAMQKEQRKMSAMGDALSAKVDAIVGALDDVKAKFDAAIAAGTGITAADVQTLSDKIDAAISRDDPATPAAGKRHR